MRNGIFGGLREELQSGIASKREEWNPSEKIVCGDISKGAFFPIWDETNDEMSNPSGWSYYTDTGKVVFITAKNACQPNLLFVVKRLIESFGYKVVANDLDVEPWNRVLVANARRTYAICETLPHWSVKEFLGQVQTFFNCTILFDETTMSARIISNSRFFDLGAIQMGVSDEFECEVSNGEDASVSSLASSGIEFDISGSDANLYVSLSDEIFESYGLKEYKSKEELVAGFEAMDESERKKLIFTCPTGYYIDAEIEYNKWSLKQVNQFGKLSRDNAEDIITCKICPVAISDEAEAEWSEGMSDRPGGGVTHTLRVQMPTMENPFGDSGLTNAECVWDGINGAETSSKVTPDDRLQVMFAGTKTQYTTVDDNTDRTKKFAFPMAFTDCKDKAIYLKSIDFQNEQDSWSFALTHSEAWRFLGQLHDNRYRINTQTEIKFTFLYDGIPDVRNVFIVHNKKYVCKKIEYQIANGIIGRLKTGYFFEMEDV